MPRPRPILAAEIPVLAKQIHDKCLADMMTTLEEKSKALGRKVQLTEDQAGDMFSELICAAINNIVKVYLFNETGIEEFIVQIMKVGGSDEDDEQLHERAKALIAVSTITHRIQ